MVTFIFMFVYKHACFFSFTDVAVRSRAAPILVSVSVLGRYYHLLHSIGTGYVISWSTDSSINCIMCIIKMAGRMRSLIWEHFTVSVNDDKKAVCKYCNVSVSRGGKNPKTFGTTNLFKHLCLNHASEYTRLEASEKAREVENKDKASGGVVQTLDDYVQKVTPFGLNHPTARKITRTVGEMIVLDNQPFSIVDDLGFKNLVRVLEPRYNLPSHRYFAEVVIPDMYQQVKERVVTFLKQQDFLSCTTDLWSSVAQDSMLSLTAHCICW